MDNAEYYLEPGHGCGVYYDVYVTVSINHEEYNDAFVDNMRRFCDYVAHPSSDRYEECREFIDSLADIERHITQHLPFVECVSFADSSHASHAVMAGGDTGVFMRLLCRVPSAAAAAGMIGLWFGWDDNTHEPLGSATGVTERVLKIALLDCCRVSTERIAGYIAVDLPAYDTHGPSPRKVECTELCPSDQYMYPDAFAMYAAGLFGPRMCIDFYKSFNNIHMHNILLCAFSPHTIRHNPLSGLPFDLKRALLNYVTSTTTANHLRSLERALAIMAESIEEYDIELSMSNMQSTDGAYPRRAMPFGAFTASDDEDI